VHTALSKASGDKIPMYFSRNS